MKDKSDISFAIRLKPGEDLRVSIEDIVRENGIKAGWIFTCVGSLTTYAIRFANKSEAEVANGYFEIISLSGTLSVSGSHMHICVADQEGKTIAGHLMKGCTIYTTAEIILVKSGTYIFERQTDEITSWEELRITNTDSL